MEEEEEEEKKKTKKKKVLRFCGVSVTGVGTGNPEGSCDFEKHNHQRKRSEQRHH